MSKPTMGSLFAGIGGFDLGFERAGFETVWQVEINEWCRRVLAKNFPKAQRYADIRECGTHNLRSVDVVVGGFPCQDISNAGDRAGITGERSGLWSHMCRIVSELRPSYVLLENVGALLSPTDRITWIEPAAIAAVLGDLAQIGYDAEWDVVSAADMGLPHLRERVWIVAYPMSFGCLKSRFAIQSAHDEERNHPSYWENGEAVTNEVRTGCEADIRDATAQRFSQEGEFRLHQSQKRISSFGKSSIFAHDRQERTEGFFQETLSQLPGLSWCKDVRRVEDLRGRSDIPEPLFRGARDGVPDWVDRVGAIGNAVVPQIPEMYARKIKAFLERSERLEEAQKPIATGKSKAANL